MNNDGVVDLFVSKGNVEAQPDFASKDPSNLLLGQADGTFVEEGLAAGIASFVKGRGAAVVDLNLDGMLDLVQVNRRVNVSLLRNVGSGTAAEPQPMGNWVAVRPEQPGPNRDAIGSWIQVRFGDHTVERELTIGGGHASGELGWVHVGLGDADSAEVRVRWPDGEVGPWQEVDRERVRHDPTRDGEPTAWTPVRERRRRDDRRPARPRSTSPSSACPRSCPRSRRDSTPTGSNASRARAARKGYDRLVVYADREHSANLAYLTGFDPRFEEAMLVVGADRRAGRPGGQRVLRHGRRGAAPDAPAPVPGLQPAEPAARPLAHAHRDPGRRGHRRREPGRRDRLEDVRRPRHDRGARLPRRRAPPHDAAGVGRERRPPADRRRRRPARASTRSSSSPRSRRGVPDLEGVRRLLHGLRPGMREARCRRAARVERHAALLPPDALERRPRDARPAQPERPADRARRPVHGRVRDLGGAELPRGVRRRGRGRAPGGDPRLRRPAGRPLLRGDRGVVRGPPDRPDRRSAARDRRSGASATRSSASS